MIWRAFCPGGQQRGLVQHVGEVGAGEAGRAPGHALQVDIGTHRLALGVHLEDLVPAAEVGGLDGDLPVEAAGTQQRRVEHVGPVGGRDQDHAAAYVEPVHLHQQLVEGLLPLVVTAAHAGPAVPADGVDLVDEHDRRRVLLGLLEQVANPGGADTDEHLHEVGPGDGEERHAGLAGDRPGQQGLAGAGWAVEQHALGDLGPDRLELRRLGQELLDLLQLLDGLLAAGHVLEGRLGGVLVGDLGLGLAELHHPAAAALDGIEQEEEQHADDDERDQGAEQLAQEPRRRVAALPAVQGLVGHPLIQPRDQLVTLVADPDRLVLGVALVLQGDPDLLVAVDQNDLFQRLVAVDDGHDLGSGHLLVAATDPLRKVDQQTDCDEGKKDPRNG